MPGVVLEQPDLPMPEYQPTTLDWVKNHPLLRGLAAREAKIKQSDSSSNDIGTIQRFSEPAQQNISSISTPIVQASFISFVVKMGAKKASLAILKKFIKEQIKDKITKIAVKKFTKQFAKEADNLLGILEDPWWVTAIGFIPVIGDGFDLVRVPKQIKTAINKANALEERVKKVLRIQGMKAGELIPGKFKNVKDYPTELEGRTYAEIVDLASGGSTLADKAKTMKKLIEQTHRLMEKIP